VITVGDHEARVPDSAIRTVTTIHVALPTRRVHKWTGLSEAIGGYVLVRMEDEAGAVGWGEAPALKDWGGEFGRYFGESAATTKLIVAAHLAPAVTGLMPGDIVALHGAMDEAIKGYPYAKAAVEFAAYDLAGLQCGLPVHRLLGGAARRRIPVTHSIGLLGEDEAEREVIKVVSEGIRTIKIKVGVDAERDIRMVRRIRDAVGPSIALCIDANQGYATPGEAILVYRQIAGCNIRYFEQPVEGIERLAVVARAIDVPVMADESAWNAHDALQIIEKGAAQIISIYTTKPGGLYRAMEVAAVCRAAGIVCNVNGSVETGVGNRANIQLAAAAPAVTLSCVVPVSTPSEALTGQMGGIYYTDDLLSAPMRLVDGTIEVPDGPGMGIPVDLAKVDRFSVN
jgi:muconate cycloisomerase